MTQKKKHNLPQSLRRWLKNRKKSKKKSKKKIKQAAVLGAGIMGGGIAYQAAYKGTPIVMKDIRDDALALGMNEAGKLLSKQVEKGRIKPEAMSATLVFRDVAAYKAKCHSPAGRTTAAQRTCGSPSKDPP